MTKRAFWDRDGWLWEMSADGQRIRPVWSPNYGYERFTLWTTPDRADYFWGPLVGVA